MANKEVQVQAQAQQALSPDAQFATYKNNIAASVMKKIATLEGNGGLTIPKNYSAGNQINLALLALSEMKGKDGQPVLSKVTPASVASALLKMCIQGLSLDKAQCYFIPYGNELQFQQSYHGRITLAKRLGGAGEPQAQVIYEGDEFEYEINPKTGKKVVTKHVQKLQNIDNAKIVGAWCLIPYDGRPDLEPKVEVMTMAEIRTSWMQSATKGQSGAHRNFTQEMVKKTIISRACKLFLSTSDDAGIFDDDERAEPAEFQSQPQANAAEAVFGVIPAPLQVQAANETDGSLKADVAAEMEPQAGAADDMPEDMEMGGEFFNA